MFQMRNCNKIANNINLINGYKIEMMSLYEKQEAILWLNTHFPHIEFVDCDFTMKTYGFPLHVKTYICEN